MYFLMGAMEASDLSYHTERVAARARDNYICQYCDKYPEFVTTDHVVPRSRGGTHDRNNLVCCCADCNGKKNDFTPQEWYERLTLESNQALSPSDRLYRRIDNLENRFGVELRPLQLLLPLPLEKQIFTLAA